MESREIELKERQLEDIKAFRSKQQKLRYYIIALSVASIGFSISKTIGAPLRFSQLPLSFAVLSWAISIYLGLRHLARATGSLYTDIQYVSILRGKHRLTGKDPEKIKSFTDEIHKIQNEGSVKSKKIGNWSDNLFYLGIVLFLVWHILEMFLRTNFN